MARLRQIQPGRYGSSDAVGSEFESIIRYLNGAEIGNNTLSELLAKVFNNNGEVTLGLGFRFDPAAGLQVSFSDGQWYTIAGVDQVRGAPGLNVGSVDGSMFSNRQDFIAIAAQTVFPYRASTGSVDVHVFANGLLLPPTEYAYSTTLENLTLVTPRGAGDLITAVSVRNNAALTYRRSDFVASPSQVVFPFPHSDNETIHVYRGGLFQRPGTGNDYTTNSVSGTVSMSTGQSAGTVITVMAVNNSALREVAGIMLEDRYTQNGNIRLDRVAIPVNSVPQDRIVNLVTNLSAKADLYVGTSEPSGSIRQGSIWINTSGTVPRMNFYSGAGWYDASPNGLIPAPSPVFGGRFLRLNSSGTSLDYVNIDFSALVPRTAIGNPNGVAALDANGRVPNQNLSDAAFKSPIIGSRTGLVADGSYNVAIISGNRHTFDGMTLMVGEGSATVSLTVGGTAIGLPLAVGTTPTKVNFVAVTRDATTQGQAVTLTVTSSVNARDLVWNIGNSITG
jgi:hypothetical protein